LLVALTEVSYLSQAVFNPPTEVCILGLRSEEPSFRVRMPQLNIEGVQFLGDSSSGLQLPDPPAECLKFATVALLNLGGSLSEFIFEPSPCALMVIRVLLAEQSECLFSAECCHTSEIFHAEAVENFSPLQVAYAHTEGTFDSFVRHW
jgi:hypothetical protein